MKQWDYLNLDLAVEDDPTVQGQFRTRVLDSPAGQAHATFSFPLSATELASFLVAVGPPRVTSRRLLPDMAATATVRDFGGRLTSALFAGPVGECFDRSLGLARSEGKGLRIRLRLSGAPSLDPVPWEYLWAPQLGRFVALSAQTPVVRYLEATAPAQTLRVEAPIRVLVMVSSPLDAPRLAVEQEVEFLRANTADLVDAGLLDMVFVEDATLQELQRRLYDTFHVFHFIGHGAFDPAQGEGVLLFENPRDQGSTAHRVSGTFLGTLLHDATGMQLAVLNACEGARTSGQDTWSGVGQSLVRQGLPAVVAMQAEISDRAALAFSHEFYYALSRGLSVDAAVSEARRAIGTQNEYAEWGTPVLLQSAAGEPFEFVAQAPAPKPEARIDALYKQAEAAIAMGAVDRARPILEVLSTERPDDRATTMLLQSLDLEAPPQETAAEFGEQVQSLQEWARGQPAAHDSGRDDDGRRLLDLPPAGGSREGAGSHEPGSGSSDADEGQEDLVAAAGKGAPERHTAHAGGRAGAGPQRRAAGPDATPGRSRRTALKAGGTLISLLAAAGLAFTVWPRGDDRTDTSSDTTTDTASDTATATSGSNGTTEASPTGNGGTATVAPRTRRVVRAAFSPNGQVIDGQVDDWRGIESVRAANQVFPDPGARSSVSGTWWLAWNQDALFIYAVVTDPNPTPAARDATLAFRGDGISFEFGSDPRRLPSTASLRRDDVHVMLALADLDGAVIAGRNNSNGKVMDAGGPLSDVTATSWLVDNGYAMEASVPWTAMRLANPPEPGETFAMNLNVSDQSVSGSTKGRLRTMVSSNPARTKQERPGLWDVLTLDGRAAR